MEDTMQSSEQIGLLSEKQLNHSTSELEFAAFIDRLRTDSKHKDIIRLLSERHPVYKGRTAKTMVRMRGYAIASFEAMGLPRASLPYITEILENSFEPYLVAASAKGLRGAKEPLAYTSVYLVRAILNIMKRDAPISFEDYRPKWPLKQFTTAMFEILETLRWMGAYAGSALPELRMLQNGYNDYLNQSTKDRLQDTIHAIESDTRKVDLSCCDVNAIMASEEAWEKDGYQTVRPGLELEDQSGRQLEWKDYFQGKYSVVVFFYTRCLNPRKCTRTIFNLVDIQNEIKQAGLGADVRTAAITYDADFDSAEALETYGNSRQFQFSDDHRMFRVPDEFPELRQAFQLGVNYNGKVVNDHRIELFLLDEKGQIVKSFLRSQTAPDLVVRTIQEHMAQNKEESSLQVGLWSRVGNGIRQLFNSVSTIVLPLIIAFFPKCPICWMAYLSFFGIASMESIPYSPWLFPVVCVMLVLNLILLYRIAKRRNGMIPFVVSCTGTFFLLLIAISEGVWEWPLVPGLILLLIGALLNSLDKRIYQRMQRFFMDAYFHGFSSV